MISTNSQFLDCCPICNVCASEVRSILIEKDGYRVWQCSECGLAFTYPQPEELDRQYDSAYFDLYRTRRPFRLKRAEDRLKRIELIKQPGALLDIGCSLGYFVEAARGRGWDARGIEISPQAAEEARGMNLDVRTGSLGDISIPHKSIDCVTMWDVLEHVPDPKAHMLKIRRILSDRGLVVIGTPDLGHLLFKLKRGRWRHLKPAEHIFYFRKSSIARLLAETGFDVVNPPVVGGRSFPGSLGAAVRSAFSRIAQPNDVMTVYGVKNDVQILPD